MVSSKFQGRRSHFGTSTDIDIAFDIILCISILWYTNLLIPREKWLLSRVLFLRDGMDFLLSALFGGGTAFSPFFFLVFIWQYVAKKVT